ncbi:ribbon-helix-helix domain-containing protein [Methanobrevibacter sp.]|uniref:ribbon-helix-helix domain-containing protein n=1 Tax=Methanobrevibacter sp. TaxID=66852 RepID=UPI002603B921|nr:ribbon-helix-helix domain-containing protein [uncultured Methanobrevibacter sp.]
MISTKEKKPESKTIGTKLAKIEYDEINELVNNGLFLSGSDFVRDAVREKLRRIKVIKIRDIDYDTAKKEVLGYYKSFGEAYISEVADNLELDLELVSKIVQNLIKEGKLGE